MFLDNKSERANLGTKKTAQQVKQKKCRKIACLLKKSITHKTSYWSNYVSDNFFKGGFD